MLTALAAAFVLSLAVLSGVAFAIVRAVDALIPADKLPDLICLFLLLVGWFVSIEICSAVIENSALRTLEWGGAGEYYFFPFGLSSILVAGVVLFVRMRRRRASGDGA